MNYNSNLLNFESLLLRQTRSDIICLSFKTFTRLWNVKCLTCVVISATVLEQFRSKVTVFTDIGVSCDPLKCGAVFFSRADRNV